MAKGSKNQHLFKLRINPQWLSWELTLKERTALYRAFHHYMDFGNWHVDEAQYLTFVTLKPLLEDLPAKGGRFRMTEAECTAFLFLFKKYYNTFLHMDGMAYLPNTMCDDIHLEILTNKHIELS